MGIKEKIVNVEIDFKEDTGRGETTVKEVVGTVKNGQEITKIEISTAIFIYRQYLEGVQYTTVDVIPFDQIKGCVASLADEKAENIELRETKYL